MHKIGDKTNFPAIFRQVQRKQLKNAAKCVMLYISKFSSQLNFRFLCVFCKSENSCLYFQYEVGVSRESPMKIDRKQIVSVSFRHMIAKVRSRQEKGGAIIMCEYLDMLEEKGKEKGEKRLASLLEKLYALGRDEDAKLAVRDEKARVRLYEELCIC